MALNVAIIKEGWVMREEIVQGSMATWKKRYFVLSLQKLSCYKHDKATEPISIVAVASVEEMSFGKIDENQSYAFSLRTSRGVIRLASNDKEGASIAHCPPSGANATLEERARLVAAAACSGVLLANTRADRESWVQALRVLVPKAKVELAKEMLMRKAKRKANLELAQRQIKESIESIRRDSNRVAARAGFKIYADLLIGHLQELLKGVDHVAELGVGSAKKCAYAISSSVDAANSTAAICTNSAIQNEVVGRVQDIAIETANMLGYATTAASDERAKGRMYECVEALQEMVQDMIELLKAAGELQQQLDDAKEGIECAVAGTHGQTSFSPMQTGTTMEANVEALTDRAKALTHQIKNIAQNAILEPERVGEFSKDAAGLMCELLEATNIVAAEHGVDLSNPEYMAGISDLSEHQRQQLESMLSAAKGFAAATTNMIDLLRQIPQQEGDENVKFRLTVATRSAENALRAFVGVTETLDVEPQEVVTTADDIIGDDTDYMAMYSDVGADAVALDTESELEAALAAIENSVQRLDSHQESGVGSGGVGSGGAANRGASSGRGGSQASEDGRALAEGMLARAEGAEGLSQPVMNAARTMGQATADLMKAAVQAQQEMKSIPEFQDVYRKDPNWSRGLVASAQSVAETTAQLMDAAMSPDATPEDVIAAARCVNGATARLVAFLRAKGDPDSESQKAVSKFAKSIAQATNQLVNTAKQQKKSENAEKEAKLKSIRSAPRTRQIKAEFEAQSRIAKLESDLDAARQELFKLRRAVYGREPPKSTYKKAPGGAGGGAARGGFRGGRGGPPRPGRPQRAFGSRQ